MAIGSVEELCAAARSGDALDYICFWGHRPRQDGKIGPTCLSQWYLSAFAIDGQTYATAEHYMMAEKARLFGDEQARANILAAEDPGKAKALGRVVRGFEEGPWQEARFDVVVRANRAKFSQNDALRYFLLGTRNKILVEASPSDRIWGIGLAADHADARHPDRWRGLNLLGFALMQVREELTPQP